MGIEYRSNNSGGRWWLTDDDWKALEAAGWHVIWGGHYFCHTDFRWHKPPAGKTEPCATNEDCPGHRKFDRWQDVTDADRHLGALATYAMRDGLTMADAIAEFERITGQDSSDLGCACCGSPHSFSGDDQYYSPSYPDKGERYTA